MKYSILLAATAALAPLVAVPAPSPAPDPSAAIARIVDEGFNHSEAVTTAEWLTDRIGSRLTNSPGMRAAEAWTQQRFRDWGLQNVHLEGFDFGRGWSVDSISVRMTSPRVLALRAIPVAWSRGTDGPVTAEILVAPITKEEDLAAWHGKLAGKIVLVDLPTEGSEPNKAFFQRYSSEEIAKLDTFPQPEHGPDKPAKWLKSAELQPKIDAFLKTEGALARVRQCRLDGGLLLGQGGQFDKGTEVPAVELAAEDYRRLARLAKGGPVTLEIDSRVTFHDEDRRAYNVVAELPGSDAKAGFVMAGAHLDSWAAADGASDNAAGVTIVMEAARILARLGVHPKRTIRFVLWSGEEQGLMGSMAYVEQHFAKRPPFPAGTDGMTRYEGWDRRFPVTKLAEYDRLAGYFNVDNGSGKIRGIYAEGNLAAAPALEAMLNPFRSMGVERVVAEHTDGTDHELMAFVGLPAFQFIQDPLDYDSRVHHTSIDTFDHVKGDDLRQASVVLAAVLLQTAERADPLPRTPLPTKPTQTDPFKYEAPE